MLPPEGETEMDRLEKYLKELTLLPGLCGHEQQVAAKIKAVFESCGMNPVEDRLGNCMVKIEGTDPDAPVIMVDGHMDSLGFVVKYIEESGFLRMERVGGIPEKVLPNTEIVVGTRNKEFIPGVIGLKAHHQTTAEEKYVVDKYQTLFADIGAESREEVLGLGINVGSPIVYKPKYQKMRNDHIYASFLDNRGACAVLCELAHVLTERKLPSTVWLVASVQEEFNFAGAKTAAKAIRPDIAIVVDGGAPADTPDLLGTGHIEMGKGPYMDLYNFHGRGTLNGTIPHPALVRIAEQTADDLGIVLQREAYIGGLTDASSIQFEGTGGTMCIDIGFPVRYCHGPCESSSLKDIRETVALTLGMIERIDAKTDFSR